MKVYPNGAQILLNGFQLLSKSVVSSTTITSLAPFLSMSSSLSSKRPVLPLSSSGSSPWPSLLSIPYMHARGMLTNYVCTGEQRFFAALLIMKIRREGSDSTLPIHLLLTNNRCCSQVRAEAAHLAALAVAYLIGHATPPLPGAAWGGAIGHGPVLMLWGWWWNAAWRQREIWIPH